MVRRIVVAACIAAGIVIPAFVSDFLQALAGYAVIAAIIVLSLVVLTGFVGQVSFCQYSFAALGAFTVGSLMAGHHWSFWLALPLGVLFAAVVGVLVGIPALRLSGLFLAILTVAVALFFDRFLLAPGTWDAFSGGLSPWQPERPGFIAGGYAFYLFALAVFLLLVLGVWNLSRGKTGRVLRAIRQSEVAAATVGLNLTAWKLAAFGLSAGLAGLAGGLFAVALGSVSAGSFGLQQSLAIVAVATVMGVRSIGAAIAGGLFLVFGPEILTDLTPLSSQWFNLILGRLLIAQLIVTPEGVVVDWKNKLGHRFPGKTRLIDVPDGPPPEAEEKAETVELDPKELIGGRR
jgi:branched-chain amino acid transport system permease protein